jgi:hypothetical protein
MKHPNCTICSQPKEDPLARQCNRCAELKHMLAGTTTWICGGQERSLLLGDMLAAERHQGERLCVHELVPTYHGQYYHVPILERRPTSDLDRTGAVVSMIALERATKLIDERLRAGTELLVHCWGGVERSPLVVAYYLFAYRGFSLEDAYGCLKMKRAIVSDRRAWLPQ